MKQVVIGIDKAGATTQFEYEDIKPLAEGGEGQIFLSTDKKHIVKIYKAHINRKREDMELILRSGPDATHAAAETLAWISHLIVDNHRVAGIITPNAGYSQWMENMIWNMSYKKWHSKPPSNRGDYRGFVQMLRQMVIGVRYLNFMGFGHADLSGRNVLCNPAAGKAVVIDMDGLVVTNFMKGAVGGTPGFMAPELVDGYVPGGKPASPTNITDRHALAVLIFQVLLWRHPLVGKRPPFVNDLEQDNLLQQTTQHALYVHHPTDRSNAVAETNYLPIEMLPKEMQELFAKTFIGGLRNPSQRPHPDDWESALKNLERDLIPCANPACEMKYFPSLDRTAKSCTFCGAPAKYSNIILATLTVLHHTGKGSYPLKGKLTQKKEVIKRTDTLTRAALFGKSVPDREKSVLQMTHDGTHWQVILQDNTIQVTLLGDSYQHLTPKRLSVGRQTVWNLQQVALITMSQLNVTCLVKLE